MTSSRSLGLSRCKALRDGFLSTVELLRRRRASEIANRDIDDYVALNWLKWNGGALHVTATGENVCRQLVERLACAEEASGTPAA